MKVSYYIRNRLLAEYSCEERPQSLALFCATCGDIWGRVHCEGQSWIVESVPCEKHSPANVPEWGRWPGSFLNPLLTKDLVGLDGWPTCVEVLPPELIKREFELYIDYLVKEISYESENSQQAITDT